LTGRPANGIVFATRVGKSPQTIDASDPSAPAVAGRCPLNADTNDNARSSARTRREPTACSAVIVGGGFRSSRRFRQTS